MMHRVTYRVIARDGGGWSVDHNGEITGEFVTKEAAFEALSLQRPTLSNSAMKSSCWSPVAVAEKMHSAPKPPASWARN